jgi:hypothetical protein
VAIREDRRLRFAAGFSVGEREGGSSEDQASDAGSIYVVKRIDILLRGHP